jgi:hypothetical protein
MKGDIDRDFYCGAGVVMTDCCAYQSHACTFECECCHRKWPTPEQYKKEYSEEYPEDGAVWWCKDYGIAGYSDWTLDTYAKADAYRKAWYGVCIACACTPWGKPPDDWRPE